MNPLLDCLQPYPFQKLRKLFSEARPNPAFSPINFGIGEPRHAAPAFLVQILTHPAKGLSRYPTTQGTPALREAIAAWLVRRYGIPSPDPATQILPTLGSREALFALAQTVLDPAKPGIVVCPNPFYPIYEGAALLGGSQPYFVNTLSERHFTCDYDSISATVWAKTKLLYVCSPANPTGAVTPLDQWKKLFDLSDRYGFVIASDECYSEIWFDEPPLGGLEAACRLGLNGYPCLVMLSSLSKRFNVPGMRSGFLAGDPDVIKQFLLYRTYHGTAMSEMIQAASIAAWNDEAHVTENRARYRDKSREALPVLQPVLDVAMPDAGFYLWAEVHRKTGLSDTEFARRLYESHNVTVLPGSYLAREAQGVHPGKNRIRIALVAEPSECLESVSRIAEFARQRH